jgi:PTH1 family peptidyl-tRNA hydrolase
MAMRLFVGLGNPGPKYANNRHNIGFMAVDAIAAYHGFPAWRERFQGLVSEGRIDDERIILLKPQQYMNCSGQSVGTAMRYLKLDPEDVVVFYDELDLAPGRVKVKRGGGAGGHNGIRDIDEHIGQNYLRVRLGIGHPGDRNRVTGYVLGDFDRSETGWLHDLLDGVARSAGELTSGDGNTFTNKLALIYRPPGDKNGDKTGGKEAGKDAGKTGG